MLPINVVYKLIMNEFNEKNSMNEDPMHCQLRSSKDATCDLELGPSTPSKDQACSGM